MLMKIAKNLGAKILVDFLIHLQREDLSIGEDRVVAARHNVGVVIGEVHQLVHAVHVRLPLCSPYGIRIFSIRSPFGD